MRLDFQVVVDNEFVRKVRAGNWVLTTELPDYKFGVERHSWRWEPPGFDSTRCACGHSESYHSQSIYACEGLRNRVKCGCRRFVPYEAIFVPSVTKEQA